MKKYIIMILIFIIVFTSGKIYGYASVNTAYSYILMDMDSGRVIESKRKDEKLLIASITKIMTI